MNYRGLLPKTFLSSVGEVTLERRYYASRGCDCKQVPWDQWAGIPKGHKLTLQARRMVTLAGSGCSFDEASEKLRELCRLPVSNDVIRRVCNEEGEQAGKWLKEAPDPAGQMAQAKGELEFYSDGCRSTRWTGGVRCASACSPNDSPRPRPNPVNGRIACWKSPGAVWHGRRSRPAI
jgi:hypothetical protein